MFNFLSVKSLKEFSSLEQYQFAEGFPVSPCNFYVLSIYTMTYNTLYLCFVFQTKSSITAPATIKLISKESRLLRAFFFLIKLC